MEQKRKISVRKVLQASVTLVMLTCCIVAIVSASKVEGAKTLKDVAVHIVSDKKYHFIEESDIRKEAIDQQHINLKTTHIEDLDLHRIEGAILADAWVANARVYVDNEKILQIDVTQRIPVARLFDQSSRTYFLDSTLHAMPVTRTSVYRTTVVTNVPEYKNDSMMNASRKKLLYLINVLQADTFWNNQVSEVMIDSEGNYELVPVLGSHIIKFGDTSMAKVKLANLSAFYLNILNRIGWDWYKLLDVRFKGQVVASPALPYKGPVDKAVLTMDWVSSVMQVDARKDSLRALAEAGFTLPGVSDDQDVAPPAKQKPADHKDDKKNEGAKKDEHKKPDDKKGDKKKVEDHKKDAPKKDEHKKHDDKKQSDKKGDHKETHDKKGHDDKKHH
jgi:cell division protein FtsQ